MQNHQNGFLPQALTLGEFFSEVVIVKGKTKPPMALKKFLLLQALKEFECNDKEAQILFFERNFVGYLESSSFLFDFYNELHQNLIHIKDIPLKDVYGDYEDHLRVLERVYESYKTKLDSYGYYDCLEDFELLEGYLQSFEAIELHIDGFISPIEQKILQKIGEKCKIILHLNIDCFNRSHYAFLGLKLEEDMRYQIAYPSLEILQSTPHLLQSQIHTISCDLRIGECAFILQKVNEWLKEGINPNKIAIVLPQEDLSKILKICDEGRNLNFAMGFEAKELQKVLERLKTQELPYDSTQSKIANLINQVRELLCDVYTNLGLEIDEILFEYERGSEILEQFDYEDLVLMFQEEVKRLRDNDVRGGKVRVIGMLETRGEQFEKVILADFIPENIPQVSHQDMFLNTKIRHALEIPTLKDKQDLQKHYYLELLKNTNEVFVLTLQQRVAPFIKEIGAFKGYELSPYSLFDEAMIKTYQPEMISAEIGSDFAFSANSLGIFKECKRKFYYRYICGYEENQTTEDNPSLKIGNIIHQVLEKAYQSFSSSKEAQDKFLILMQEKINQQDQYQIKIQLELAIREMQKFWQKEQTSFPNEILGLEVGFKDFHHGLKFTGKIDRIDRIGESIRIIDYKYSSNFKNSCNPLQSAIYWTWVSKQYPQNEVKMCFYDLKSGELLESKKIEKDLEDLEELIEEIKLEREFAMSIKHSPCRECVYHHLCQR